MHHEILTLFCALSVVVIGVFTWVYLSSRSASESSTGLAHPLKQRMWFITILFVVLAMFASITIPKSPYYVFAKEQPTSVIHVSAGQFFFLMSHNAINPETMEAEDSIAVRRGELVEFRVTSLDVNHGFAIYGPHNELVAQTQAMPGYVNNLRWKFMDPGVYSVYCLEYCGMAHSTMQTSFTVN